jgi:hypothetical protein
VELQESIRKTEAHIEMYEKFWNVRVEKTEQNTMRVYFYKLWKFKEELAGQEENYYAKVDLYFDDDKILVLNAKPKVKNLKEIEGELNGHRRMDLFMLSVRKEFQDVAIINM